MPFVLIVILAGSISMQRFETESACIDAKKAVTIERFKMSAPGPVTALCMPAGAEQPASPAASK